jgi:hypothetical protein
MMWIRNDSQTTKHVFFSKNCGGVPYPYEFFMDTSSILGAASDGTRVSYGYSNISYAGFNAPAGYPNITSCGEWTCISYWRSRLQNQMSTQVNGISVATIVDATVGSTLNNYDVGIGYMPGNYFVTASADILQIMFWSRVLTKNEICRLVISPFSYFNPPKHFSDPGLFSKVTLSDTCLLSDRLLDIEYTMDPQGAPQISCSSERSTYSSYGDVSSTIVNAEVPYLEIDYSGELYTIEED